VKVTALAGGVGGAKLLVGLQRALAPGDLTAIVNTGDDATIYGVDVSPDVDIVTYWLAGIADTERGWGIRDDRYEVVDALDRLGRETWFRLGDRDLATCLLRTERRLAGASHSQVADEVRVALNVPTRVIPMSDDPVRTKIHLADGRTLDFQDYFVGERQEPAVAAVSLEGLEGARPAPGVLDAIRQADRVVVCPSNPVVSIGPIVALPGVRAALATHPSVVAVSPIVGGEPLKGPADKMLRATGHDVSASGVAAIYADFCDLFIVDRTDAGEVARAEARGVRAAALDTIMSDHDAAERLAVALLRARERATERQHA
jgi:LPPG:FO 2-phospho-L-lactate transferase